jgi:hypothetical protein
MKKQIYFIIYIISFLLIITSPFWLWQLQPSKKLNVLIMDKTVPNQSYREHKGLVWILNNAKYFKNGKQPYSNTTDYKGFEPEKGQKYRIAPLPKNLNQYDLIYLTDQYGVYNKDFYSQNLSGTRSSKIYGGLTSSDVNQLEKSLISSKRKTLIAEFNTFASPTAAKPREEISNLLNLDWSGWIGRYFPDLNNSEVPKWVKDNYEKENKKWSFSGEGFVFVSSSNYIVVIGKADLKDSGLQFQLTKNGKKHFSSELDGKYQYWFDIISPRNPNEVLASYKLPVSNKAKDELAGYGIPTNFPAVIYHENAKYSSYYFSGDYADEGEVPQIYQTKGFDAWKRTFVDKNSFYWEAYVPMMKDILKNGLHKTTHQTAVEIIQDNGIKTNSKTSGSYIQIQENGKWKNFLIKGVNIGIGKPGYFPGETAITKEEYLRWFKEIGAMNANAIRVYTLHPPQFYQAFYEYNQMAKKPLFLFHGTWVNEENLIKTQNAFNPVNVDDAKLEIKNMIDIIHGNANLPARPGHASGIYKYDISKYVIGMIIGTEWDPYMVRNTNEINKNAGQFSGEYFRTVGANPFENWLAGLMDYAAGYETKTYHWQHSLSFTNWVTTDLLKHPAEPLENEDLVSVDPNHIKAAAAFNGGVFASYHIYPYYPDFLNYEKKYLNYVDKTGKKNNYAGYLHDLHQAHHMPVLVAEFGVPSSRGLTHKNAYGMNQGFHSEQEQGEIDSKLFKSIVSEGYAGGLVFTWQDEWFKRTWNTMDFDDPDRRPYWNNQETNEQHFGLLDFEPGQKDTDILVDGTDDDWNLAGIKPSYEAKDEKEPLQEVRMTSNSGYVYFLLKYNQPVNFKKQAAYLLLDTIGNQGETNIVLNGSTKVSTENGNDFLIKLQGPKDSRIIVDSYYDTFYYQYAELLHMVKAEPFARHKNNGVFNPIRLALNKQLTIPSTNTVVPFQSYETGVLKFGNGNPVSKNYNSLTDVSISSDKKTLEVRIPWQLLNVKDPSLREVMDDLWEKGLTGSTTTKGINLSVVTTDNGDIKQTFPRMVNGTIPEKAVYLYEWKEWDQPRYFERLKQSYGIMKETYNTVELKDGEK